MGCRFITFPISKPLLITNLATFKGFIYPRGKVIIIASMFIGALNSFTFSGKAADSINDSALASVSKVITPLLATYWCA